MGEVERVAHALVTVERAEHGLPSCRFDTLTDEPQARYIKRAEAAISAMARPTSPETRLREALIDMLEMREIHMRGYTHPKGEMQIVSNARAALAASPGVEGVK